MHFLDQSNTREKVSPIIAIKIVVDEDNPTPLSQGENLLTYVVKVVGLIGAGFTR
jgi:hypothetical protein